MAETLQYDFCDTSLGECLIATTRRGICHLHFVDGDREQALAGLRSRWPASQLEPADLSALAAACFDGGAGLPLADLRGTDFQNRVWRALLEIPRGHTKTYGEIAAGIGRPDAARAVGAAVGSNPIGVLVPCHRVLPASGGLGGYRWGPWRKRALLQGEASATA